ncbi:MAG: M28 family peptidase [Acidobacteria bacterium]|nr:M28 family peptidase [Acidobacteriota bacterium]MCG2814869.1 M28 family peptidase [Candidatus Aminicenantes bacterium]MBU4203465.1 M28 family peptidase [Acidobacteriota bacterium]MBU4254697.1 M28 family peptidase [Acidobacteriota bacterium]MBU4329125.1 M28 family peptidase [Acidobacteriota bacterium]
MKKRALIVCLCLVLVFPLTAEKTRLNNNLEEGLATISGMDVYGYCRTMAEPRFAGRHTGHEGYTAAAEWAAALFKSWGLRPISSEEGYLQAYLSPYVIVNKAEMSLEVGGKTIPLKPGPDFLPLLFSDSGDGTAELVFAGWGISAPELGYDDYTGIDVKGRFVVCFRGTPDPREQGFIKHDHHRFRMQTAKDRGALGLFYIYDSPLANPNGDWIAGFTPAILSEKTADLFLAEKDIKSADLRNELRKTKKPGSFHLSSKARFIVDATPHPEGTGYNVVGYVEGSDPELKKECLVIGGHFDHCGQHMGVLYPGANDNASGSAVVMEIGQAFASLKEKPKRSVIFVLFGGEEMGLQGSTYFADHVPTQFTKTAAMFNFDMVGEGDGAGCGLGPEPKELKEMLEKADESVGILRNTRFFRGVGVRGSDYAPFYNKGIPCVSFSSNGPHLFYHLPGDTIYRINPDVMADISRLAFLAAYYLANL